MRERLMSIFLAACLLTGTLPPAYALGGTVPPEVPPSGPCGPNAAYDLEDGVLTISGAGEVRRHDWPEGVTSIVVEDGITALREGAFPASAADVSIPDSVTYIHANFLSYTGWLKAQTDEFVLAGDGILVKYNGPGGEVTIPDTVRAICGGVFSHSDITAVTVGGSVEHIGERAFLGCSKLETVSIADTISDIEGNILADTPWMRAKTGEFVVVGDHVLIAYKGPGGVVVVPDGVRVIADGYVFGYRQDDDILHEWISVTEITIPDSVVEIGGDAIRGGYFFNGAMETAPVIVHGAAGSAAQRFCRENEAAGNAFHFVPFGQEGDGSLFNFMRTYEYSYMGFPDVPEEQWYYDDVENAYEFGLMKGKSNTAFDPGGQIKVSETVTVAARVRDIYYHGQADFTAGEGVLWYRPYADYALEHDILKEAPDSYDRPATRAEFAAMLAAALPEKEFQAIHSGITFTDLDEGHPAYAAVMALARAGVMQGKGEGRFDPDAPVKRCEAAAMLSRCVLPDQRIRPDDPTQPAPQEELPVRESPLAAGYQDYYAIRADAARSGLNLVGKGLAR